MGLLRYAAASVRIVALTVPLALAPTALRANPGCSVQDLANAIDSAFDAVTSSACASTATTGVGVGVATTLIGALAGVAASAGQGSVNDFCNAINSALSTVGDIGTDANTAQQIVNDSSSALSSIALFISDAASAGIDPLNIAECACQVEQGLGQAASDLGGCACDVAAALLGSTCNCTPPPPQTASCASNTAGCADFNDADPACQGGGPGNGPIMITLNDGTSPPVVQVNGPSGTTVTQYSSSGACASSTSCFCPKPMQSVWVCNAALDYNCQNNGERIFACVCPSGTTVAGVSSSNPSGNLVDGVNVCICNNTGLPAEANGPAGNPCPSLFPPPCPRGQTYGPGGKCVATCASGEILLAGGTCCDPLQASSCGTCCPSGQAPDPATGACVTPPRLPTPGPHPPLR
jgi:hypothetical protein